MTCRIGGYISPYSSTDVSECDRNVIEIEGDATEGDLGDVAETSFGRQAGYTVGWDSDTNLEHDAPPGSGGRGLGELNCAGD